MASMRIEQQRWNNESVIMSELEYVQQELGKLMTHVVVASMEMYIKGDNWADWVKQNLSDKIDKVVKNAETTSARAEEAKVKAEEARAKAKESKTEKDKNNAERAEAESKTASRHAGQAKEEARKAKSMIENRDIGNFDISDGIFVIEKWIRPKSMELSKIEVKEITDSAIREKVDDIKLKNQSEKEHAGLEKLRQYRNSSEQNHRSKNDVDQKIILEEKIQSLRYGAYVIIEYINIIEERYKMYALFDQYYRIPNEKNKFDQFKVRAEGQLDKLYEIKFCIRRIEELASNWNKVIDLLSSNDLDVVDKYLDECSGDNTVDSAILEIYNYYRQGKIKKEDIDYEYFKLLYCLNPRMQEIYWKGKSYSQKNFAREIIYKIVTAKNKWNLAKDILHILEFDKSKSTIKNVDIDIISWSEKSLLSTVFYAAIGDEKGQKMAKDMEEAMITFYTAYTERNEDWNYDIAFDGMIRTSAQLYFYMYQELVLTYNLKRRDGQYIFYRWKSLEELSKDIKYEANFYSYDVLYKFVEYMCGSEYFKVWKKLIEK